MMDQTLSKFGYPASLVKEYPNWRLLCRPKQVTLGSLILISKQDVQAFSELSPESFIELNIIIKEIETKLTNLFSYDKINYIMLMMVDPEVHFHIFPRYKQNKEFVDYLFVDSSWPMAPNLEIFNTISDSSFASLVASLKRAFATS